MTLCGSNSFVDAFDLDFMVTNNKVHTINIGAFYARLNANTSRNGKQFCVESYLMCNMSISISYELFIWKKCCHMINGVEFFYIYMSVSFIDCMCQEI